MRSGRQEARVSWRSAPLRSSLPHPIAPDTKSLIGNNPGRNIEADIHYALIGQRNGTIHIGDRMGILGLNGCGMSNLMKLFSNTIKRTRDTISYHPKLRTYYHSQHALDDLSLRPQPQRMEADLQLSPL